MKKKMPNLLTFEDTILQELLLNINNKFSKKFKTLNEVVIFIKTLTPELLIDDFNYELPKFSIIPEGTIFYRRQKTNSFQYKNQEIWLDYTGTMSLSQFSFLKDINQEYTNDYLDATTKYFGEFLMQFKVNKNLLIFHFPSYASSYFEGWFRHICVHTNIPICIDGYTSDFLKYNPNKIYKDLPSLDGYRELCILNDNFIDIIPITPPQIHSPTHHIRF